MTRPPRIPKKQQRLLFKAFVLDLTAVQASSDAKKGRKGMAQVSRPCATRYFRHYRELIYEHSRKAPRFEGEVEVDIGFFSGRAAKKTSALVRRLAGLEPGRIVAQRKTTVKEAAKKQMVLGILRRGGDVYLHPVRRKDRATLEPVIRLVVEQGATIYTDMEKGLSHLKFDGYKHESINHALEYSRPGGIHINGIESFWRECRRSMGKNFRGIPQSTLLLHIKEREFRYNNKDMAKALKKIL